MTNYSEAFREEFAAKWNSGMATAEMARVLGMKSKNAVIGLRNRMELPSRPSPIRFGPAGSNPAPKQVQSLRRKTVLKVTPAPVTLPEVDRPTWLRWFSALPLETRRRLAQAKHVEQCPLTLGGGMWQCTCGATRPGFGAVLQASDHPDEAEELEDQPEGENNEPEQAEEEQAEDADDAELEEGGGEAATPADEPDDDADEYGEQQEADAVQRRQPVFATGCCYPKGRPGHRDFRYCDAPVRGKGSYCDECRKLVYVPEERRTKVNHRFGL